jgi:ribosomal protein L11 methyltransferase
MGVPAQSLHARAVADRVWEREWLRDFHSMRFGNRLWVTPRHETVADANAIVVQLDPGLAFGTGTHPTTAMCLQWLDSHELAGRRVVDFGCGSGVLAIAALKLGASRVHAYDIDPQALRATAENAAQNEVAERLTICTAVTEIPPDRDVVLANILADTLLAQMHTLEALVGPRGYCVLSGILSPQESEVASAFGRWSHITCFARREDWVTLSGRRYGAQNAQTIS